MCRYRNKRSHPRIRRIFVRVRKSHRVEEKAAGVLITGRQRIVTTAGGLAIVTRSVRSVVSVILTGRIVGPRRLSTDVMDAALDYLSGAGLSIRQMAPTRPFELAVTAAAATCDRSTSKRKARIDACHGRCSSAQRQCSECLESSSRPTSEGEFVDQHTTRRALT